MAEEEIELVVSSQERKKANEWLVDYLQTGLSAGSKEVKGLRLKLSITYGILVVLSVIMFLVGVVLLSVPIATALQGQFENLQSLITAGFGIADLAALFLFKPIERIHRLMGDMGQITLAINSYQTQAGLRLLEINLSDRATIG